jgi:hypothetical protein
MRLIACLFVIVVVVVVVVKVAFHTLLGTSNGRYYFHLPQNGVSVVQHLTKHTISLRKRSLCSVGALCSGREFLPYS